MRCQYPLVCLLVCTLLSENTAAQDPDINHSLDLRWAYNTEQGEVQVSELNWQPDAQWSFNNGGRLSSTLALKFQAETGLRPADMQRSSYSKASRPALLSDNASLELRELYYEQSLGNWYLTLGKQQLVWGAADGLKVLDVVNPQSFQEFILLEEDQSRIPLWAVNAEYQWQDWTVQLLWIPDKTYHALPEQDAVFAFTSPRLVPQKPPHGVAVHINDAERPERFIKDSDAGLRLSAFIDGWDLSLNYLYQYDNLPALHQSIDTEALQPAVTITPEYHRTHVLGSTISRAMGHWVFRGELAWFSKHYFLTDNSNNKDGVAQTPEFNFMLGLDWSGIENTLISVQSFQSWLVDYNSAFTRPELDINLTFLVRRSFWNESLQTELLFITNSHNGDGLIRPKISYDWQDNIRLNVGMDVFYGDSDGLYGQFDGNDRFFLEFDIDF